MRPNRGGMKRLTRRAAEARTNRARDDVGATLLLALLFLGAIGTIVGAIASWTSNDLNNTLVFNQQRNTQTALTTATNVAIQNIRYTPLIGSGQTLNASPPSYCFGTTSPSKVTWTNPENAGNQIVVDVWCSTVWNPTSAQTRIVTFSACLDPVNGGNGDNAGDCAGSPGLQTQVTFDDYSASNPGQSLAPCSPPPAGTCGSAMTISSSLRAIQAPTVSGLSSTSGPVTGTGSLTVTGTNFENTGTAVYFVLSSPSTSRNVVLTASGVTVNSTTSLTVPIPTATTTGTYNVVVSGPNGTSATGAASQYIYTPVAPTVSNVTTAAGPATGSAAGGLTVTITGSGFLDSSNGDLTTVQFIDTQNANNVYTAPSSTVSLVTGTGITPGTQLTAATPAISSTDMTYYVVVVTAPGGSSGTGSAPVFTYQPLLPLVASAVTTSGAATQGGPGAQLTLTGVGFISGNTTVTMVPTSGTSGTLTLTNVSVTGSTTLTATLPSGGKVNQTYYVAATTPSGTSGTSSTTAPVFTYT
jgi:IPT/TIG domain